MDTSCEMLGCFKFSLNERLVNDELCLFVRDKTLPPDSDLPPHRVKAALHTIHANRDCIDEAEVFCMLREDGTEVPLKRHVVADEDAVANRHRKTHRFIVCIPNTDRKAASFECGFQVEDSKHLHTILRNSILVSDNGDMPKRKRFEQGFDNQMVGEWVVAESSLGSRNESQLFTS